jgi:glycosyltransferase involved in cell wall biosynthesis
MRAVLTVASFSAEYGGPALSVARLGTALASLGLEVGLWAPDGSARSSAVVDFAVGEGANVARLGGSFPEAVRDFGAIDILHDNGIWLPYNHLVARYARKNGISRVVSTHGMLEPWALQFRSLKKRVALFSYQRRDLQTAQIIHATAPEEAANISRLDIGVPVEVVPNGVDLPKLTAQPGSTRQKPLTMLFMSRVHPKKGLPLLIEALSRIEAGNWRLIIAGPDELGHTGELDLLIRRLKLQNMVSIVGPVWGHEKDRLFSEADLFVLPTYSENFAIVIAEALAYEVPVLTTTGAPWRMLQDEGCGWWVEPTVDELTNALTAALATTSELRRKMGKAGRALVSARFSWTKIAAEMIELYVRAQFSRSTLRR